MDIISKGNFFFFLVISVPYLSPFTKVLAIALSRTHSYLEILCTWLDSLIL